MERDVKSLGMLRGDSFLWRATTCFSALAILAAWFTAGARADTVLTECDVTALTNALAAGGRVTFACDGTFLQAGPVTLTQDVTLDGAGRAVSIRGGQFMVATGVTFTVIGVDLTGGGGSVSEGRIVNRGRLNLIDLAMINNAAYGTNGRNSGPVVQHPDDLVAPMPGAPAFGGAVLNAGGMLYATNVQFLQNWAAAGDGGWSYNDYDPGRSGGRAAGGAIYSTNGGVVLVSCLFDRNEAVAGHAGGGYLHNQSAGDAFGGALYCQGGSLRAMDCEFVSNIARSGNGGGRMGNGGLAQGGALWLSSAAAGIESSTIHLNKLWSGHAANAVARDAMGGGIYTEQQLTLEKVRLSSNQALAGDVDYEIRGEAARGLGGALCNLGVAVVRECEFTGNWNRGGGGSETVMGWECVGSGSGRGGAIFNDGSLGVERSLFADNRATGGVPLGVPSACANVPSGSGRGGAIANEGFCGVTNSTFAGNSAVGGNTAVSFQPNPPGGGYGGGIWSSSYDSRLLFLENVTVVSNRAMQGGRLLAPPTVEMGGGGLVGLGRIRNSILAFNGASNWWSYEPNRSLVDRGHNLSSDASCLFTGVGSLTLTDPLVGPLQDNGGFTATMALLPGSAAIDAGDDTQTPPTDQRGFPRIAGGRVDIGAYEYLSDVQLVLQVHADGLSAVVYGRTNHTYWLQTSGNLIDWAPQEQIETDAHGRGLSSGWSQPSVPAAFYRVMAE